MTPIVAVWVLSLSGAGLFFLGGHMFSRVWFARANAQLFASLSSELHETRAHLLDQEQTKQKLRTEQRALSSELSRSHAELNRVQTELGRVRRTSNPLSRTSIELDQMESEITQLRHDCTVQARALTQAERSAAQSQAELARLSERLRELSERSDGAKTGSNDLEQELQNAKESLRAREAELTDLRSVRDKLKAVELELASAQRSVSRLSDEARALRSRAFKDSEPPLPEPPRPARSLDSKGHVLQALVDAETKTGRAKTAVVADEHGLLVASSGVVGEYDESMAALGAYLSDISVKLQDMLPMCAISQVIVRDDQALTLSVRPLPLDQPGLSLVTLGEEQESKLASDLALS